MAERPLLLTNTDKVRMATDITVPWPYEHDPAPQACPMCGGRGSVLESIDAERWPVAVPCTHCRRWCADCRAYVRKDNHECKGGKHATRR
jgi:hypothetical protein